MKFEKTYLSRAMTRAMSLDHPIGDPTGGPAYAERRDPVSAVIAVASMWEAGAVIAGAATIAEGFAALSVAQGLMFAGGALNLVGNVSGNKDLMVLGTALTIGGGLGGWMSDAGTGFNQTFSEAFTPTPDPSTAANALTNAPAANATPTPASGNLAEGGVNPAETTLKEATSATKSLANEVTQPVTSATLDTAVPPANYSLKDMAVPSPGLEGNAANGIKMPGAAPTNPMSLNTAKPTGLIDDALSFAKVNPMAAMVLGQAGSGVATGVMDMATGKTAAQTTQLNADAAYRNSVADKTNRDNALQASRIAQLNANLKAQFNAPQINVNPNAVTMTPQQPGLITGARV